MIRLSVPTAKALLKFASSDKHQPNLYGIGITSQGLATTDGFAAVQFSLPCPIPPELAGRTVDRKYFETSTKIAAVTKSELVINTENLIDEQLAFPRVSAITPKQRQPSLPGVELVDGLIRINPQYLALLDLVAVACETQHVVLSSVQSDGPLRFDVTGDKQSAIVIISQG